jgi:hypothetical protein
MERCLDGWTQRLCAHHTIAEIRRQLLVPGRIEEVERRAYADLQKAVG